MDRNNKTMKYIRVDFLGKYYYYKWHKANEFDPILNCQLPKTKNHPYPAPENGGYFVKTTYSSLKNESNGFCIKYILFGHFDNFFVNNIDSYAFIDIKGVLFKYCGTYPEDGTHRTTFFSLTDFDNLL